MTAHDLDHDRLRESAGLYVLDALDASDRAEFDRHVRTCVECAAEVRSLRAVTAALPHALPLVDPPAALRSRVMGATGGRPAEAPSSVVRLPPRPVAQKSPAASGTLMSGGWLAAAALLIVSIGLGAYAASLQQQVGGLRAELQDAVARLDRSEQQVAVATRAVAGAEARMAVLTAPDMAQVNLEGQTVAPQASGRAFWSRSRGLVFTASNLPPLPAGRSYQLWVVTAQAPVSAGLLQLDTSGRVAQAFETSPDIPPPVAMAVTIEPEGGVPAPTGDKYLVGLTH